jgi:hypothetical protein
MDGNHRGTRSPNQKLSITSEIWSRGSADTSILNSTISQSTTQKVDLESTIYARSSVCGPEAQTSCVSMACCPWATRSATSATFPLPSSQLMFTDGKASATFRVAYAFKPQGPSAQTCGIGLVILPLNNAGSTRHSRGWRRLRNTSSTISWTMRVRIYDCSTFDEHSPDGRWRITGLEKIFSRGIGSAVSCETFARTSLPM